MPSDCANPTLVISAVTFWIETLTSSKPGGSGHDLRDWLTTLAALITIAGLGGTIKGWIDLFKPDTSTTQIKVNGGSPQISTAAHAQNIQIDKLVIEQHEDLSQPDKLHQLPSPPADFTGREKEINQIIKDIQHGATISGLQGLGGIGKTALGLVIAHQLKNDYPEAQIFLDLRGTQGQEAMTPAQVMSYVIHSFHPEARLPDNEAELHSIFYSILHDKKVLLFFDNARNREQVEPLLPPPACLTLVTSRQHFDLPGLSALNLESLTPNDAQTLIRKIAKQVKLEEAEVIAKLCDYLPMALRLAASMLNTRPDWTPAVLTEKLHNALVILGPVEASLQLSYEILDDTIKMRFRQLGVFPAPFSQQAASAVWEIPPEGTDAALGILLQASLLGYDPDFRKYVLHDLVRQYAEKQLLKDKKEEHAARLRHAQYYSTILEAADDLYLKGGKNILRALQLFDAEWAHIQAAQGWLANHIDSNDDIARLYIRFTDAPYCLDLRLHPRARIIWLGKAIETDRRLGYRRGEGVDLGNLGNAYAELGYARKSIEFYEKQLVIVREIGDRNGEGNALGSLGNAYAAMGDARKAIEFYEKALVIDREIGDRRNEGNTLGNLGNAYTDLGDARKSIEFYENVLVIAREIGDRRSEGNALGNLGIAYAAMGDARKAIEFYEKRMVIAREIGDRRGEGNALFNLGLALYEIGNKEQGIEEVKQALTIYEAIESPYLEAAKNKLKEWTAL